MSGLKLLIIDERLVLGQGLRSLFSSNPAIASVEWISEPCTSEVALRSGQPDVALVSVSLGHRSSGAEIIGRLRRALDGPAVVALVDSVDADTVRQAVEAGAIGVVSMEDSTDDLVDAVLAAGSGVSRLPAAAVGALMAVQARAARADGSSLSRLTPRERQVLELLVSGMDRRAIAASLYCSPQTVRTHIRSVLRKLGAHSTLQAVDLAVRLGVHS